MNPLILLLGLLGAGAGLMGGSSSKGGSSTTTARFEAAPPPADDDETPPADADRGDDTSPPVTDEDEDPVTDTNDDDETPTTGSGDTDTTGSTDTGTDTGSDTDTDTNTGTDTGSTDTSGSGSSGSGTSTTTGSGTSSPPATNTNPTAPTQTGGTGSDGGSVAPSSSQSTVDVIEGRVTTIQPNTSDITSITITSGVPHGNVTVNPDNTFALVMTQSSFTGSQSFTYEATHSDGSITQHTVDLNVQAGTVANGWSDGTSHYMLETDANDNVIVEYGDNHRAVYISGSQNALSINDIAALEGRLESLRRQEAEAIRLAQQAAENYNLFAEQQRAGQRGVSEVVGVYETKVRAERTAVGLRYDVVLAELRIAERLGLLVDGDRM